MLTLLKRLQKLRVISLKQSIFLVTHFLAFSPILLLVNYSLHFIVLLPFFTK